METTEGAFILYVYDVSVTSVDTDYKDHGRLHYKIIIGRNFSRICFLNVWIMTKSELCFSLLSSMCTPTQSFKKLFLFLLRKTHCGILFFHLFIFLLDQSSANCSILIH